MPDLDLDALLDTARRAALAGGAIVADACGGPLDVRAKGPGDWVSDADTASERAVRAVLTADAPTIEVVTIARAKPPRSPCLRICPLVTSAARDQARRRPPGGPSSAPRRRQL